MFNIFHQRPCFKRPGLILVLLMLMNVADLPGDSGRATGIINDSAPCEGSFLLVGSFGNDSVKRYQGTTGAFIDTFVPSSGGGLDGPNDLAFGPDDNLYVSSRNTHSILRYDGMTGAFIDAFIPSGVGGLTYPEGFVFGPDSNLYAASSTNSVLRYDGTTGAFIDVFIPPGSGGLDLPDHLIFGPDGNLYVNSRNTKSVLRYDGTTGAFINIFVPLGSGGLGTPFDSAFGPDGDFYISSGSAVGNTFTSQVGRYNGRTGEFIDTFIPSDSSGSEGMLFQPNYLVFGPDRNLYVNGVVNSDIHTAQVRRYTGKTGAFMDIFVPPSNNGGLNGPTKMVFSCLADPPTTGTVVAGEDHLLALEPDGTLWAWGHNGYGQLGEGTTTHRLKPVRVAALTNVRAAAGGGAHSLALKTDGSVWAWGWNRDGQLGDGTTIDISIPVQVPGISEVAAISAGKSHSLAVKSDGTLWSWGRNQFGQLGKGTTENQVVPVQVKGPDGAITVAAGEGHSLALLSDGTVWAWGWNEFGQLGDATTTNRTTPVQVDGLTDVVAIAAGFYHNLAVKADGTVWAWGRNNWSQLGDGTTTDRTTPVRIEGLAGVKAIAAGFYHSLALTTNGTVWNWGDKTFGQLANDSSNTVPWSPEANPVQALGVGNAIAIAGGKFHSLALRSDGSVQAWGANWYGQLSNGATDYDRHTTPVDVNEIHFGAKVAAPVITPPGGTFVNSVSVTLTTSTPGSTIRYTTNGSDPTAASTLYNGTFDVNTNSTVKARAFRSGYADSEVASASFVIIINSDPGDGDGLTGTYYNGFDLSGASVSRIDPVINFTWGQGAPDPAIREDGFSSRWSGQVKAQYSETYTFHIFADDAVRLWVNGQLIVDHWFYDGQEASGTINLVAGVKYNIRLEHRDGSAGAAIFFKWSSPSTPKSIIPQSQLYSHSINDSDGDGLPDDWEQQHFGNLNQNGNGDFDGDGLTNIEEYDAGTDPTHSDTDNDGMPDGWEVIYGLDPTQHDAKADPDGDGVNNLIEYLQGRNPTKGAIPDTDGVVRLRVFTPLQNSVLR